MEKLKSVFSPGHKKDDVAMYNTPDQTQTPGATGKVGGQGSHFGSGMSTDEASPTTDLSTSQPVTTTGTSSTTIPSQSRPIESMTGSFPTETAESKPVESTPAYTAERETAGVPGQADVDTPAYQYSSNNLNSGNPTSSVVDPNSSDPTTFRKPEASNRTAMTGTGVGAGAALTAASRAFNKPTSESNAASGISSGGSTVSRLEPRTESGIQSGGGLDPAAISQFEPQSERGISTGGAAGPSDVLSSEPRIDSGLDGGGASGPSVSHPEPGVGGGTFHDMVTAGGPPVSSSRSEGLPAPAGQGAGGYAERMDERASGSAIVGESAYTGPPAHHRKESIPTTAYPSGRMEDTTPLSQPVGGMQAPAGTANSRSGYYAAPAEAAGGAGVLGATAYERERYQGAGASAGGSHQFGESENAPGHGLSQHPIAPGTGFRTQEQAQEPTPKNTAEPLYEERRGDGHLGRDAALGAGVVGAGAVGEHEYSRHGAERAERERVQQQLAEARERERLEKGHEKQEKRYQKELEKEEKAHEKAIAREEKEHEKEVKKHHKELEKEDADRRKREDKEAAAAMSGLAGGAGLGLGTTDAARTHGERELETQRNMPDLLNDPEGRALGGPGLGAGAKDAARQYREAELDRQHAMPDPEAGQYGGSGLGSGMQEAGATYSAKALGRERALSGTGERPVTQQEANDLGVRRGVVGEGAKPAGIAGTGAGGAAAYEAERQHDDHHTKHKEKKPGLFGRIFKRRKNQDTGESEEYSSDEEHNAAEHHATTTGHHPTTTGGATAAGATGAAEAAAAHEGTHSGAEGFQKPSYNPFKSVDKEPRPEPVDAAGHY